MTSQTRDTAQQPVQFPIIESFTQAAPTNPSWRLLGSAKLNGGGLELTPDTTSKAGTAFLDQPFSSALGVDAVVRGEIPAQLEDVEVTCQAENGAVCGTGSVAGGLTQPMNLPRGSKVTLTLRGTVAPLYEGSITATSLIASPSRANTAAQQSGQVTTNAELPLISVSHKTPERRRRRQPARPLRH